MKRRVLRMPLLILFIAKVCFFSPASVSRNLHVEEVIEVD